MKRCVTQRLFWKKWPYKIILDFSADHPEIRNLEYYSRWTRARRDVDPEITNLRRWHKKNLEDTGIRSESGKISLFLENQEQVDQVLDAWGSRVIELWAPENPSSLKTMQEHVFDIVRKHPWYRKFPIRVRFLYTKEFRNTGLPAIRQALEGVDAESWLAAGALKTLLEDGAKPPWPYGQPYYLYLASNDDAIMLKLQVGDWIDRFERQRKP